MAIDAFKIIHGTAPPCLHDCLSLKESRQGCKLPLAHSPMRPYVVCGLPEIKNWSPTWRLESRGE